MSTNSDNTNNANIDNLLQSLIEVLDITPYNLEQKLDDLQAFILNNYEKSSFPVLNDSAIKILMQLQPLMADSFFKLPKMLRNKLVQITNCDNVELQVITWLTKDFTNAHNLYTREYAKKYNLSLYKTIQNNFIASLIRKNVAQLTNKANLFIDQIYSQYNEDTSKKTSRIFTPALAQQLDKVKNEFTNIIADYNSSFNLANCYMGKNILQLKYIILSQHSNLNCDNIVYACILPSIPAKRQADFVQNAKIALKTRLLDANFFYRFKLEIWQYCNLAVFPLKETSSLYAFDGKICLGVLEKLIADFLFVNNVKFQHYSALGKPKNYPNFFIESNNIKIFIRDNFTATIFDQNGVTQNLTFGENMDKTTIYKVLETNLENLTLSPLMPKDLSKQTINLLENIFINQGVEILNIWRRQNLTIENLKQQINSKLTKIYSSNSIVYLLLEVYAELTHNWVKNDNYLFNARLDLEKLQNQIFLLDTSENLCSKELQAIKLNLKNKFYLNGNLSAAKSLYPQIKTLANLAMPNQISLYNLDAYTLNNSQLNHFKDNLLMARLDLILQHIASTRNFVSNAQKITANFTKPTIAICLANNWQIEYCKKWLGVYSKINNIYHIKYFSDFTSDLEKFIENFSQNDNLVIVDFAFLDEFIGINASYITTIFADIGSLMVNKSREFYRRLLSLPAKIHLIFKPKFTSPNFETLTLQQID